MSTRKEKAWENAPQSRSVVFGKKLSPDNGLKEKTNKKECFYCERRLTEGTRTKDHVLPKSKGHALSRNNKVYACETCNQEKSDKTLIQWKQELESIPADTKNIVKLYLLERREIILNKIELLLSKIK